LWRWRLTSALALSFVLHATAMSELLWPARRSSDGPLLVELVGAPQAGASQEDASGSTAAGAQAPGWAPALGAQPAAEAVDNKTSDPLAALVAERDALSEQLTAETTARTQLGDRVAALTDENRVLAAELADERGRAARLEQALAERRAAAQAMYDELLAALRREIADKDVELRRAREGLAVSIVDRVLFPSGQATLTPAGREVVDKVAHVLAATPSQRIVIEGHTDDVPIGPELRERFPSNWELSTARASEVVRELVAGGVPPPALQAVGRADTQPVASNETEAGRRRNRRIEIILSGSTGRPEPGI
jgi:chemotaxis protein MotB